MKKRFITILFVIITVFGCLGLSSNNSITAYAADSAFNNPNSENGVRIKGWSILSDMDKFGNNNDSSCGQVAMAILLQFYNQLETCKKGKYIPNDALNYEKGTNEEDRQQRADNLHALMKEITFPLLWGIFENASSPERQSMGLTNYLLIDAPQTGAESDYYSNISEAIVASQIKQYIDNDIPILLTL